MIPPANGINTEENEHSESSAALGAAVNQPEAPIDPDLQAVIDAWPALDEKTKGELVGMVGVVRKQ